MRTPPTPAEATPATGTASTPEGADRTNRTDRTDGAPSPWPTTLTTPVSFDLSRWARWLPALVNLSVSATVSARQAISLTGDARANVLTGHAGTDTLRGRDGDDRLLGLAGHDLLDGGNGHDSLNGGSGNDVLLGGAGNDTLVAGEGSDTLSGGTGADLFTVRTGQGLTTLTDFGTEAGVADTLLLDAGVRGIDDLIVRQGPSGTTLSVRSTGQSVLLQGTAPWATGSTVQVMLEGQRQTLAWPDVQHLAELYARLPGTAPATWSAAQQTYAQDGLSRIWMQHLAARNPVWGTDGADTLQGDAGDDMLFGGLGDDTLRFNGGSDVLMGNAGADTYEIEGTAGQITLIDQADGGANTLSFVDDGATLPEFLSLSRIAGTTDLLIRDALLDQTITVKDWWGSGGPTVSSLRMTVNGQTWSINARQIDLLVQYESTLSQDANGMLRLTPAQRAQLRNLLDDFGFRGMGAAPADGLTVTGTDATELMLGGDGNDTLFASWGNDTLRGGLGSDTYQMNASAHHEQVTIQDLAIGDDHNTLVFNGIDRPDLLWFHQSGNNLVITNTLTERSVVVSGWYSEAARQMAVELHIPLKDSTTEPLTLSTADVEATVKLHAAAGLGAGGPHALAPEAYQALMAQLSAAWRFDLSQAWDTMPQPTPDLPPPSPNPSPYVEPAYTPDGLTLTGTDGADQLEGSELNDVFLCGAGNDEVYSEGGGNDTVVAGLGNDTVFDVGGSDLYIFDADSGQDRVTDLAMSAAESDTFRFLNVSIDQLWFTANTSRVNGLQPSVTVTVLGTDTRVTLDSPSAGANQNDVIEVRNGSSYARLDMTHLQNLVSTMAGMTAPATAASLAPTVQAAITANWVVSPPA